MADPTDERTINVDGEDHTFENIAHLEKRISFKYKTFLGYQSLDEDCLSDDVARDIYRIAQQLLKFMDHHASWAADIDQWQKEQNERARSDLWRSICNLPPDPFNSGRSQ
ncbi:MAG: hypothetical protein GW858_10755 [Sphingomonadales bacterium]|nr:hypothetical protein [Sphingomonadales bacterium]NCQ22188.1 hypothetical protein [Sphingomonadales bacterium]NCT03546.1 hypothetical protein [Sphingomonadales bacterium]